MRRPWLQWKNYLPPLFLIGRGPTRVTSNIPISNPAILPIEELGRFEIHSRNIQLKAVHNHLLRRICNSYHY
jgi:hypothetical protein